MAAETGKTIRVARRILEVEALEAREDLAPGIWKGNDSVESIIAFPIFFLICIFPFYFSIILLIIFLLSLIPSLNSPNFIHPCPLASVGYDLLCPSS